MSRNPDWSNLSWAILLAGSLLLGGGGANYGLLNLSVQVLALILIATRMGDCLGAWRSLPVFAQILIVLSVLLPLLQSVFLPPSIWQLLPGRVLVAESFAVADAEDRWFSLSVDPRRSLLAASALLVPLCALLLARSLGRDRAPFVALAIAYAGIATVILGALQLASGNSVLVPYSPDLSQVLYGTFANRNSTGLFLVLSLICLIGSGSRAFGSRFGPIAYYAAIGFLALATLLTQSRSASGLLLLPLGWLVVDRLFKARDKGSKKDVLRTVGIVVALGASAVVLALSGSKIGLTWDRYDDFTNLRWGVWADTVPAIQHYWPVGSGMGTFRETIEVFESLEVVNPLTSGRAHNEYLELALEGGVFTLALLFAWLAHLGLLYRRALVSGTRPVRRIATACMLSFAAIALQSAVDYPLRNLALLCVAASLYGVLLSCSIKVARRPRDLEGV